MRRKISATENVVREVDMRVLLPMCESEKPTSQEFTFNQKVKFNYSSDVRTPLTLIEFNFEKGESERSDPMVVELQKSQLVGLFEEVEKIKEHLDKIFGGN